MALEKRGDVPLSVAKPADCEDMRPGTGKNCSVNGVVESGEEGLHIHGALCVCVQVVEPTSEPFFKDAEDADVQRLQHTRRSRGNEERLDSFRVVSREHLVVNVRLVRVQAQDYLRVRAQGSPDKSEHADDFFIIS